MLRREPDQLNFSFNFLPIKSGSHGPINQLVVVLCLVLSALYEWKVLIRF